MQNEFTCYVQFSLDTDNNELTLAVVDVEGAKFEDTGLEQKKTIVLKNPSDIETSKKEVIEMFRAMLPAGKYVPDFTPLVNEFLEFMDKVKDEIK